MTPPAPATLSSQPADGLAILAPSPILCRCLQVREDKVIHVIEAQGCQSVSEVTAMCGAGGGCTCCHRKIRKLLRDAGR